MGYIVTAPLVIAKNHEGGDLYVYGPALVPEGQTDEWIQRHLADGMIAAGDEVSTAATPSDGESKPSQRRTSRGDTSDDA